MMSAYWHELDSMIPLPCGCPRSLEFQCHLSEGHLHQFLAALRPEFSLLTAQLLHRVPLPTLDDALIALIDEETRLRPPVALQHPLQTDTALVVPPRHSDVTCNYCKKVGHMKSACPTRSPRFDEHRTSDHRRDGREELILRSPLFQSASSVSSSAEHSLSAASGTAAVRVSPNAPWYFDSGASCHLTSDFRTLTNCTSSPTSLQVTTADGGSLPILRSGSIAPTSATHGRLTLSNVHHASRLHMNLISVSSLCDLGLTVLFSSSDCVVQDSRTAQRIGQGRRTGGLYQMEYLHVPPHPPQLLPSLLYLMPTCGTDV
ncbi:hypothetical protein KSP39_PZI015597 [Platanthera zijinensis]|uniref:Retrovirus-related Pol polyprotein from transposon TNT 1-94-like beta-barrel domain-containing protein n=1 Tax=Platanthera zijinensis TaxID=2320716 RepID=A0AAP0B8Y8_9ASPA